MKITKEQLKQLIKEVKDEIGVNEGPMGAGWLEKFQDTGMSPTQETHNNRVKQGSGVLTSKMSSLVDQSYNLADKLNVPREEARRIFINAGKELQNMKSPSDNPVTKLVIEQLKFLQQPGVLVTEIGQAMTAFDE